MRRRPINYLKAAVVIVITFGFRQFMIKAFDFDVVVADIVATFTAVALFLFIRSGARAPRT